MKIHIVEGIERSFVVLAEDSAGAGKELKKLLPGADIVRVIEVTGGSFFLRGEVVLELEEFAVEGETKFTLCREAA